MQDRRGAQRLSLPKPVPATLGGFAAKIVEVSLLGCQIEHSDRVLPHARMSLRFKWRGKPVKVEATVMRSEMRSLGGKPGYLSGLEFCDAIEYSPAIIREVVDWLVKALKPEPAPATATKNPYVDDDDEPEVLDAPFLQCTLGSGEWMKLYVTDRKQPSEGFTIPAPSNEAEVEVLCRAYEKADAKRRQAMRASFELAIAQKRDDQS
ncbi:MAG TPA: PilZ domain-containing protein [Thermoanaerobaculia bacterium]